MTLSIASSPVAGRALQANAPQFVAPPSDGQLPVAASSIPAPRVLQLETTLPLPPPAVSTAASRAESIEALSQLTARPIATDLATLLQLFMAISQQQRKTARSLREASLSAQVSALHKVSDLMKEAADKRYTGAMLANTIRLGTGIAQGRFAVGMAKMNAADTGSMHALQLRGQSLSELSGAVGGYINASFEREAARLDATSKTVEAQARREDAEVSYASELMQTMLESIRDTKERLAAIESSRADTTRGMLRNI